MPTNLNKLLVLAADDEARFWALREAAWAPLGPGIGQARHELAARLPGSRADTSLVVGALPVFLETLASRCRGLPGDELATLDRVLERQLYEIDRADIHAVTGGSDDGFLYSRGFVVALGQDFYHGVIHDPQMAVPYAECERSVISSRICTGNGSEISRTPAQESPVSLARTRPAGPSGGRKPDSNRTSAHAAVGLNRLERTKIRHSDRSPCTRRSGVHHHRSSTRR